MKRCLFAREAPLPPDAPQIVYHLRSAPDQGTHRVQATLVTEGRVSVRGVTGVCLLGESHIACHTFPEHGSLCLNLFCCRPRAEWDFAGHLKRAFGATTVRVRRLERPYLRHSSPTRG